MWKKEATVFWKKKKKKIKLLDKHVAQFGFVHVEKTESVVKGYKNTIWEKFTSQHVE